MNTILLWIIFWWLTPFLWFFYAIHYVCNFLADMSECISNKIEKSMRWMALKANNTHTHLLNSDDCKAIYEDLRSL